MSAALLSWAGLACGLTAWAGLIALAVKLRGLSGPELVRAAHLQELRASLQAIAAQSQRLEQAQQALGQAMTELRARQDQIEAREPESRPYRHAIALVKNGAGLSDVTAVCGLSRAEAELILAMHGRRASEDAREARQRSAGGG